MGQPYWFVFINRKTPPIALIDGVFNGVGYIVLPTAYEQPDVFPQPSHTKHAPDIRIFTPHVIHSGASDLIPIDSRRSDEDPIVIAGAAASIFTETGFAAT